ncbi:MAG: hypothetical protein HYX97_01495 [Chloroflexi bacterium]|nr:hypothetical protein [Chloroflexota bacterium]
MNHKQRHEERRMDFYVLPLVGGAIVGFVVAEWIGASGILGLLVGVFAVDSFCGLRGMHRFVEETEHLVQRARNARGRRKEQQLAREMHNANSSSR